MDPLMLPWLTVSECLSIEGEGPKNRKKLIK